MNLNPHFFRVIFEERDSELTVRKFLWVVSTMVAWVIPFFSTLLFFITNWTSITPPPAKCLCTAYQGSWKGADWTAEDVAERGKWWWSWWQERQWQKRRWWPVCQRAHITFLAEEMKGDGSEWGSAQPPTLQPEGPGDLSLKERPQWVGERKGKYLLLSALGGKRTTHWSLRTPTWGSPQPGHRHTQGPRC